MSDRSGSSRFEVFFEVALGDYEKQTGISLAKHPLAARLQECQSIESVTAVLQEQARSFSEFRKRVEIMKSLKGVVSTVFRVSTVGAFGHYIGMVRPWSAIGCST